MRLALGHSDCRCAHQKCQVRLHLRGKGRDAIDFGPSGWNLLKSLCRGKICRNVPKNTKEYQTAIRETDRIRMDQVGSQELQGNSSHRWLRGSGRRRIHFQRQSSQRRQWRPRPSQGGRPVAMTGCNTFGKTNWLHYFDLFCSTDSMLHFPEQSLRFSLLFYAV